PKCITLFLKKEPARKIGHNRRNPANRTTGSSFFDEPAPIRRNALFQIRHHIIPDSLLFPYVAITD
ncbi:MAG TPA: hypothetical protein PLF54_05750, partial [Deltaproteobacteria bacterium]|nr:hypothetical protein [Deltaproteobacteria bacterium]